MADDYLNKLFAIKGKKVLVTGATGQLGEAICKAYVDAGAEVAGWDKTLNTDKIIDNKTARYDEIDITDKDAVFEQFGKLIEEWERVDILVNNAGVSVFEPFESRPEESIDQVMDVNLKGTFFCIQAFVHHADKHKFDGNIINVGSHYGVISPDPRIYTDCERHNSEIYGATKAGIIQMTRYFAVHLAERNIRVNAVSPGGIYNAETPQGEDFIKNYSFRCPMNRMADTQEIIGAVLYLSSNAASYTNGHNIVVDGAMSCW